MFADWTPIYVMAIVSFATFIRSAFGFGEALIAVPLLALIMPVEVATPVAVLVSITVAGVVVAARLAAHTFPQRWLVGPGDFGRDAVGFAAVDRGRGIRRQSDPGRHHRRFLDLLPAQPPAARARERPVGVGIRVCAGVLGGAYGMNGPPLVIYGSLRGWSPQHFRATLQGYFLPASLAGMCGYWLANLWTPTVTYYYLVSLPLVVAAILLGRAVNRRLSGPAFLRYVHVGLIAVGGILLYQSVLKSLA